MLYYLSGLTCNDENVIQKSGCQRAAAKEGIAFVAPDTSPRELNIEGDEDSWDLGTGAGFYVNATETKWKQYQMYDYITKELPETLRQFKELDLSNVRQQQTHAGEQYWVLAFDLACGKLALHHQCGVRHTLLLTLGFASGT